MTGGGRGTGFLILRTYPVISGLWLNRGRSTLWMYRMGVDGCAGLLAAGQAEETVFHAISCRSNQAKGPGLCPGLVLFPGPGCGLALRVLLFLAVMGHQGASVAVWISCCGKRMGICVRSLYGDSTNVRKKDGRWVQDDCKVHPVTLSKAKSPFPAPGILPLRQAQGQNDRRLRQPLCNRPDGGSGPFQGNV